MTYYDWNQNGRKNTWDSFADCEICNAPVREKRGTNGGISIIGALAVTVLTVIITALITGVLEFEGASLIVVSAIIAPVIGICLAFLLDSI